MIHPCTAYTYPSPWTKLARHRPSNQCLRNPTSSCQGFLRDCREQRLQPFGRACWLACQGFSGQSPALREGKSCTDALGLLAALTLILFISEPKFVRSSCLLHYPALYATIYSTHIKLRLSDSLVWPWMTAREPSARKQLTVGMYFFKSRYAEFLFDPQLDASSFVDRSIWYVCFKLTRLIYYSI